jgi:sugar lactone lactonase YvrE
MFDASGRLITAIGGPGQSPGKFRQPFGVAWDGHYIYVADTGNSRVQKFDRHLQYISTLVPGVPRPAGIVSDSNRGLWLTPGELSDGRWPIVHINAKGEIVGSAGPPLDGLPSLDDHQKVWIADRQAADNPVMLFDPNGRHLRTFKARTSMAEQIAVRQGVAVIGDRDRGTLGAFDVHGHLLGSASRQALRMPDGYIHGPYGLAFDEHGNLWACFLDAGVLARFHLVKQ